MKDPKIRPKSFKGFTIMEMLVGLAIFAVLIVGVLGVFSALSRTVKIAREKTVLSDLASNYMEIVRNMPYSDVGTISGSPSGTLADFSNPINTTVEAISYKIFYEVTYIDDPSDGTIASSTDPSPADYKQVKMSVQNLQTGGITDFFTSVVPEGLEGTISAGAIKVKVLNYSGGRVSGANIHIEYPATSTPLLILDRTSDSNGEWIEVGLTPDTNAYKLVVTKAGYSTDQTYPITVSNPNPINPHATVAAGVVTEITFSIDLLANLTIRTIDEFCADISGVAMNVRGEKLIGTSPSVYKYNQDHTSSAGAVILNNIEWDTYTPTLLTGGSWEVRGTSPIQKITVLPATSQTFTMVLGAVTTGHSLLVIVKDASTGAALEGASVHLQKGGSTPQDYYGITGGSVWVQQDWSGGSGQALWSSSTPDMYFSDDGNIDANSAPTGLRLKKVSGRYVASGWAESSTFDTGTDATNFSTIVWEPTTQAVGTTLKFQVATASSTAGPWNYLGPDGTSSTFYTTSGNNLASDLDNKRYVRYKAYLSTTDDKETPILTTIFINYVSGCYTPGQVFFGDLTSGNNYDLDVTLSGYATFLLNDIDINGNQALEVLMSPP